MDNTPIFVVGHEEVVVTVLQDQLSYFGYTVHSFTDLIHFQVELSHTTHAIVIINTAFFDDGQAGINAMQAIQQSRQHALPVIFYSNESSLSSRLAAVQAGGMAYLLQPLKITDVLNAINNLLQTQQTRRYRILHVNEQANRAEINVILQQAGMEVLTISDTLNTLEHLHTFRPDLLLLDSQFANFSGVELTRAIRQILQYIHLPIILLSEQIEVGHEILSSKTHPQQLVQTITSHIQRADALQSQMRLDPITGVYSDQTIKNLLIQEMARVTRTREPLTFAILKIDQTADETIMQSLARLLKQRLRSCDLIGRYGANELAVILVNCQAENARDVLGDIRYIFSQQAQHITFSGGLANSREFSDLDGLLEAAQSTLLKIAQHGGNQIQIATQEQWERY